MEEVQQFMEEAVKNSCEGLMVKALSGDQARYDIARRSHNWLKVRAVLGLLSGRVGRVRYNGA